MKRLLTLSASLAILLIGAMFLVGGRSDVLDLPSLGIILGVPLLILLATQSSGEVCAAYRDAFSADAEDLPASRRARSGDIMRSLSGQTLAVGILVMFAGGLHFLGMPATEGGSVSPSVLIGTFGGLLLAPFYGLAVSALVYSPLAARLGSED